MSVLLCMIGVALGYAIASYQRYKEKQMATVREVINAKIAAAEQELVTLRNDLVAAEASGTGFLEHEVEEVRGWFAAIAKHVGL